MKNLKSVSVPIGKAEAKPDLDLEAEVIAARAEEEDKGEPVKSAIGKPTPLGTPRGNLRRIALVRDVEQEGEVA